MKLNLPILIKLVVLALIGRCNPSPFQKVFEAYVQKCSDNKTVNSIIADRFQNCSELKSEGFKYTVEQLPYMCLLTLNMAVSFCEKQKNLTLKYLTEDIKKEPDTLCPISYSMPINHLGVLDKYLDNFLIVKNHLSNVSECQALCKSSENIHYYCLLMWHLNNKMKGFSTENLSQKVINSIKDEDPLKEELLSKQEQSFITQRKQKIESVTENLNLLHNVQSVAKKNEVNGQNKVKSVDENLNNKLESKIGSEMNKNMMLNENDDHASSDLTETKPYQDHDNKSKNNDITNKNGNNNNGNSNSGKVLCTSSNSKSCQKLEKNDDSNFTSHKTENIKNYNVTDGRTDNINNNNNKNVNEQNFDKDVNQAKNRLKDNEYSKFSKPNLEVTSIKYESAYGQAGSEEDKEQLDTDLSKMKHESNIDDNKEEKNYVPDVLNKIPIENEDAEINNEPSEKILLAKSKEKEIQSDEGAKYAKDSYSQEFYNADSFFQTEDSHFSAYFLMTISIIIIGYIIYHNKNKIVAYALEGRRSRNARRRPHSASYRKLDCNLEEAIASNPSHASVTNVVY